jgi:hypothetical protein
MPSRKRSGASSSGHSGSKPRRDANGLNSRSRGGSNAPRAGSEAALPGSGAAQRVAGKSTKEPRLVRNQQRSHPRPNDLQVSHGGARASFAGGYLSLALRALVPGNIVANAARRILNSARLLHRLSGRSRRTLDALCRERKRRSQLHLPESALCAVLESGSGKTGRRGIIYASRRGPLSAKGLKWTPNLTPPVRSNQSGRLLISGVSVLASGL